MTEPTRVTVTSFPLDFSRAEHRALMVEHVVALLAEADDETDDDLDPFLNEHFLEHSRQLAQSLPVLWPDSELPEPIAELVRRFGPTSN
jgi:hypothetical protein